MRAKSYLVAIVPYLLFGAVIFLMQTGIVHAQLVQNQSGLENLTTPQRKNSSQWGPPYPFTPDELRQNFMTILSVPANDLSKEKVEKIFGMKFKNSGKLGPESLNYGPGHEKWYLVYSRSMTDWYFYLGISVTPRKVNFAFTWWSPDSPPDPYKVPICLDIQPILKEIEASRLGWTAVQEMVTPPDGPIYSYFFRKGKDELLTVSYLPGTTCMTDFIFNVATTNGN